MKREKAITLIALVITIIILLILAGISIMSLSNSGLFEKTREAQEKSKNAQEQEEKILGDYENEINNISRRDTINNDLDYANAVDISSYTNVNNKYTAPKRGYIVIEFNSVGTSEIQRCTINISEYPFAPVLKDNESGVPEHFTTLINANQTIYLDFSDATHTEVNAYFIPFK